MESSEQVASALRRDPGLFLLVPDLAVTRLQSGVFAVDGGSDRYLAKWIDDSDRLGQNELRVNRDVLPALAAPAPRLCHLVDAPGGRLALWEWVEGADLRTDNRGLLPDAFTLLGALQRRGRTNAPVWSHYTERAHADVAAWLADETALHFAYLARPHPDRARVTAALASLTQGGVTVLHGDFHPGNIILSPQGLRFVDWAHSHIGVGWCDLDYVVGGPGLKRQTTEWWDITGPDADAAVTSYIAAAGESEIDPVVMLRAVMLLSELRRHTNSHRFGVEHDDQSTASDLDLLTTGGF